MLIMRIKFLEDVLKKNSVLYHIFGLFLVPALLVCAFTAVSSLGYANYEYLPSSFERIGDVFFYISTYAVEILLFFCVGAFCFALYERNALSAVLCAVISLFHAGLLPMCMFFMRSLFLSAYTSAAVMDEYWSYDVYSAMSNSTRVGVGLAIALVVALVFTLRKNSTEFKKPYITPKSEPAVAAIAFFAATVIFSTLVFTLGGMYSHDEIIALITQIIFAAAGYFVVILGAYAQKCFGSKCVMDNLNKN